MPDQSIARTQHPNTDSLCCESMQAALELNCSEHDDPFDCPDSLIAYNEDFKQYALIVHDDGRDVHGAVRHLALHPMKRRNRRKKRHFWHD